MTTTLDERHAKRANLFDVENVTDADMPNVADMTVAPVHTSDIQIFAQRYHYSEHQGAVCWRYGLWHSATLLGVVSYNMPTRNLCESVFGPEHHEHVWHMSRLVLADHVPRNAESRLISLSIKAIQHDHPHVWAIVTYADPTVGHIGYIYQASNALYIGTGGDTQYYVTQDNELKGTYAGRYISADEAISRGWTVHQGLPKHRYLYLLGSKTHRKHLRQWLRYDVLPYPKPEQLIEYPVDVHGQLMMFAVD